jgi:hypothetical protein
MQSTNPNRFTNAQALTTHCLQAAKNSNNKIKFGQLVNMYSNMNGHDTSKQYRDFLDSRANKNLQVFYDEEFKMLTFSFGAGEISVTDLSSIDETMQFNPKDTLDLTAMNTLLNDSVYWDGHGFYQDIITIATKVLAKLDFTVIKEGLMDGWDEFIDDVDEYTSDDNIRHAINILTAQARTERLVDTFSINYTDMSERDYGRDISDDPRPLNFLIKHDLIAAMAVSLVNFALIDWHTSHPTALMHFDEQALSEAAQYHALKGAVIEHMASVKYPFLWMNILPGFNPLDHD